jgi:hypothetical protein
MDLKRRVFPYTVLTEWFFFIMDKKGVCFAVEIEYLKMFRLFFVFNVKMLNEYTSNAAVARLLVSLCTRSI